MLTSYQITNPFITELIQDILWLQHCIEFNVSVIVTDFDNLQV